MKAIDLFCGAGGLTRGLLNAGISVAFGIDSNDDCKHSFEANNAPAIFIHRDVSTVSGRELLQKFPKCKREELIIAGCAPCQPFSPHRRGDRDAEQSRLLREFGRLVAEIRPGWVFMENVPGLAKVPGFSTYRRFQRSLEQLGYKVSSDILDARDYGVPQIRRRLVFIASRVMAPMLPEPTHGPAKLPYRTVRDVLAGYPPLKAGERHPAIPNHAAANISMLNLKRLQQTPKDGGTRLAWQASLRLQCHYNYKGHSDVYGRLKWDLPAPTLTCRCYSISNGRYGHPEQDRALSFREAATLQTFPNDYVFFGKSQESIGAQIGNAVPVLLAEAVARKILSQTGMQLRR